MSRATRYAQVLVPFNGLLDSQVTDSAVVDSNGMALQQGQVSLKGWFLCDDSQTPAWTSCNTSQTPGWVTVNDYQ
jgi:hypothetical protein